MGRDHVALRIFHQKGNKPDDTQCVFVLTFESVQVPYSSSSFAGKAGR